MHTAGFSTMPATSADAGRSNVRQLQDFLGEERLEVTNVSRGAASGTRRLLLGDRRTTSPTHVVSVAITPDGAARVEAEARHLAELREIVRPALRDTLPSVVGSVDVGGLPGIVLSAVPGLGQAAAGPASPAHDTGPVLSWLTMLWSDTSGKPALVDLGAEAYDALLARFAGSRRAAPTLGVLQRSRSALAANQTARTVSHGCLCPRHLPVSEDRVVGADDWGRARFGADPLRDLGTWVVRASGQGIKGVFAGRTGEGRSLRDFVIGGLAYWGIPSRLWRDVLVLALAEAALEGIEEQHTTELDLLAAVSHGLRPGPTTGGTRP